MSGIRSPHTVHVVLSRHTWGIAQAQGMAQHSFPQPAGQPGAPVAVVNSGPIPSSGTAGTLLVQLGGTGMAGQSSYTSRSGRVRVTASVSCIGASGAPTGYQLQLIQDGTILFGPVKRSIAVDDTGDGLGPNFSGEMSWILNVLPNVAHSYGVRVHGETNEGGGTNAASIQTGFAGVTVEDV
jgi:hypothetical protein